jgi:hypothetical protein
LNARADLGWKVELVAEDDNLGIGEVFKGEDDTGDYPSV